MTTTLPEPAADTAAPAPAAPEPLFRFEGRFAVYLAPDESVVISYQYADPDTPTYNLPYQQHVIPGYALAAAAAMGHMTPTEMIAKLTGSLT